jgi:hypothetical protein
MKLEQIKKATTIGRLLIQSRTLDQVSLGKCQMILKQGLLLVKELHQRNHRIELQVLNTGA